LPPLRCPLQPLGSGPSEQRQHTNIGFCVAQTQANAFAGTNANRTLKRIPDPGEIDITAHGQQFIRPAIAPAQPASILDLRFCSSVVRLRLDADFQIKLARQSIDDAQYQREDFSLSSSVGLEFPKRWATLQVPL